MRKKDRSRFAVVNPRRAVKAHAVTAGVRRVDRGATIKGVGRARCRGKDRRSG